MMRYVFESVTRQEIVAQSEEEARLRLEERGFLEHEFELLDVWSEEEGEQTSDLRAQAKQRLGAEGREELRKLGHEVTECAYCGKTTCEHKAQAIEHLNQLRRDANKS